MQVMRIKVLLFISVFHKGLYQPKYIAFHGISIKVFGMCTFFILVPFHTALFI